VKSSPLPIDAVLPNLIAALRTSPSLVLQAPTGAGKTTRVPPAVIEANLCSPHRLVMLEPRRLAARAAARRMAAERGSSVGEEVGYHVRFDRQAGPQTRMLVVTPGILLRMLHDDPFLESTGAILFDEFHERSLESDLVLGMVRLVQQTVRPELRIVVMSATLNAGTVATYLGNCPIVTGEGRLHPVEIRHEARAASQPMPVAVALAVRQLLQTSDGDVLAFLPGLYEIRQTARHLEDLVGDVAVLPLHGDLPPEQQDAALLPQQGRKVVLATNVAETSVTVEGITGVVDSGQARVTAFDPAVGLDRLRLMPISRASADQRAGRAGRTRPGVCIRLWSEAAHRARPEQAEPEIRRVDLAGAILHLLALGEKDVLHFPWLEPPPEATVIQALALLRRLGAVDDAGITDLGRTQARLPVHPRLARLLVEGQRWGQPDRVALAAALLAERDPFDRTSAGTQAHRHETASDVLDRIEALEAFGQDGRTSTPLGSLHRGGARFILRARDQLQRSLRQERIGSNPAAASSPDEAVLRALLAAFPDRLARRRQPGSPRGVMIGGRGVRLAPGSRVAQSELFLCIDVDAGQAETLVRQASAVERDWLPAEQLSESVDVAFDADTERMTARRRRRFGDLVLDDVPAHLPDNAEVAQALAAAASAQLERVLPAADSPAALFLIRVRCLRLWMPELKLPSFDETQMREMLPWLCAGRRSFADLRNAPWLDVLLGQLTHAQRQAIDREAPERVEVPSGSHITLTLTTYEVGRPPVLAARIQEMFGLEETPRVAGGKVPVLLHLLAPNYRPQQVTDDLASFWTNTYAQVRKELRARYPKHAWPEDPWTATAQRRPGRKRE